MKLYPTSKDDELYYYFNAKGEKRWKYRHRYYDVFGKRREKSKQNFTSENKAYRELLQVRLDIMDSNGAKTLGEDIKISDWLDIWFETKKDSLEISTKKDWERIIEDIIKPKLSKYRYSDLDLMTYERVFINELLKKFEPSTVRLYHSIFKIAVNSAVKNETFQKNKFVSITIPDKDKKKIENFLTQAELVKLLNTAKERATIASYTALLTLASTGMRKGEANGLIWKNINFEKQTIIIESTRDDNGVRTPKTKNSFREIPIDDVLTQQLNKYQTWCKKLKLSFGEHLIDDDFVFISKNNKPSSSGSINFALDVLVKRAGVKRITPHGLRHTHATLLLNQGISVVTVAKRLGNTPQEIHRTYGHSDSEADLNAVNTFAKVMNT